MVHDTYTVLARPLLLSCAHNVSVSLQCINVTAAPLYVRRARCDTQCEGVHTMNQCHCSALVRTPRKMRHTVEKCALSGQGLRMTWHHKTLVLQHAIVFSVAINVHTLPPSQLVWACGSIAHALAANNGGFHTTLEALITSCFL
jgi:hypothetical protein